MDVLVRHYHEQLGDSGQEYVLACLREHYLYPGAFSYLPFPNARHQIDGPFPDTSLSLLPGGSA